jgi:hypothetical protein
MSALTQHGAQPVSRYVCREHPDYPVTWRGTGCAKCAHEQSPARAVRSWRAFDGELPGWASGAATRPTTTERD